MLSTRLQRETDSETDR